MVINKIKEILIKEGLTISVAESCTGGNLQSLLTSVDGSSNYFDGGVTAYNIDQKVKHLGVDRQMAKEVNCISEDIAEQMAFGVCEMFETNIGISTTGYIDRFLYYTIVINGVVVMSEEFDTIGSDRSETQKRASHKILENLVRILESRYSPDSII